MFSKGGDKRLNSGVAFRALEGSEGSSYFLFGFQTTDIPLGLIIGKRNGLLKGKSQPPVLVFDQSVQYISPLGVGQFFPPLFLPLDCLKADFLLNSSLEGGLWLF
jgi:hypothetical protein